MDEDLNLSIKFWEYVSKRNYLEVMRLVNNPHIDVNLEDYSDRTPLDVAIENRDEKIIGLLLSNKKLFCLM